MFWYALYKSDIRFQFVITGFPESSKEYAEKFLFRLQYWLLLKLKLLLNYTKL